MAELTAAQVQKMRHALGLDQADRSYRNRYVAPPLGDEDWPDLVAKGLAYERDSSGLSGRLFCVSAAGRAELARRALGEAGHG